jgi:hypothetical protein
MVVMVDIGGTESNDIAMVMIVFVQHLSKDFSPRFSLVTLPLNFLLCPVPCPIFHYIALLCLREAHFHCVFTTEWLIH